MPHAFDNVSTEVVEDIPEPVDYKHPSGLIETILLTGNTRIGQNEMADVQKFLRKKPLGDR